MTHRFSICNRRPSAFTYVEALVVIGLIMIALAFLIPTLHDTRRGQTSSRVQCASNLRQIGQAMLLYANDNKGAYPYTTYATGATVIPTWGTGAASSDPWATSGPQPNDVTAALFLLLRTQDITPEVFTCPSSDAEKWDFGGGSNTALNWSNWVEIKKHLSYSMQNPYANDAAVKSGFVWNNQMSHAFAVAADMNPGMTGGANNVTTVTTTSSASNMKAGNSRNHEGDGQNVLYGDGHVSFEQNPFVGVQRDNIYTTKLNASAVSGGPIVASPFDATDSILLPTAD
jgi:prepilin-type processing-associated H-X9-DG protein